MANDYPQIVDKSTLTGVFQSDQFLEVGVEGQADAAGTSTVALPVVVSSAEQSDTLFGAASNLGLLVKTLLARGLNFVTAAASVKGNVAPTLVQRQAAWANLNDNPKLRIIVTDSTTQADHVALADAVEQAEGIQNKQFTVVGVPAATAKAAAEAWATAVASKRAVVVGPCLYDTNGNLLAGQYGAAYVAAMIAMNPDIADSMNLAPVPATTGIELEAASGLPVFRLRSNAGVPVDDFQDLLTAGFSPFQVGPDGRASLTHVRTTYTTDDTFDALMTLLIKDQVFIDIRDLLTNMNALRSGNTQDNRSLAAKAVERYLTSHSDWVQKVALPDGTTGYGVSVTPSADLKSYTVNFHGQVVRGTNVININGTLTIPVSG